MKSLIQIIPPAVAIAVFGIVLQQDLRAEIPASNDPQFTSIEEMKTNGWIAFHGRLSAVDRKAGTITVAGRDAKRVFFVTGQTQITKRRRPATLKNAVIGEEVGGVTKLTPEGKAMVIKVGFGKTSASYPKATVVPGKTDKVFSPYAPTKEVDIKGIPKGAFVRCPYTGKAFVAP